MNPDVVGTLAAIIVLASFIVRGEKLIRFINLIGSAVFVVYGYLAGNYVLLFLGVAVVLVHCAQFGFMFKIARSNRLKAREEARAAKAEAREAQLRQSMAQNEKNEQNTSGSLNNN